MRAVLLEVPEALLEERRRKGLDVFDEVWDGVLHMVPPPSGHHQRLGLKLGVVLLPLAEDKGLVGSHETGLFRPGAAGERDYRVPDLVFARPENASDRGVDGMAELVVEILSPGDESYDKLGFYADLGVGEVLVVDPETRTVELFVLKDGSLEPAAPDAAGTLVASSLDVSFATVEGPRLRVSWAGGSTDL